MIQFSDDIYYWDPVEVTDRPIIVYIKGKSKSLLFDAGNSKKHAKEICESLESNNLKHPSYIVISHAHLDHWLGLTVFDSISFSSIQTKEIIKNRMIQDWKNNAVHRRVGLKEEHEITEIMLNIEYGKERGDIELRAPDIGMTHSLQFDLGGINCSFDYIGGNHSNDSSVLYIHQEKLLLLGDILYIHNYEKQEVDDLYQSLKKYGAKYYIDSHNKEIYGNKELDRVFLEMVNPDYTE
jgi:glyoxylase-like metal-dependent hydrolase (beta-lactamase superfamily II)